MRSRNSLTILLVLALLGGAAALALTRSAVLGLDLRGGAEMVLQATPEKGQELTPQTMQDSISILRNRVDSLGIGEPEIRQDGSDRISIAIAGVRDPARLFDIVGSTGNLYFLKLQNGVTKGVSRSEVEGAGGIVGKDKLYDLLTAADKAFPDAAATRVYAFDAKTKDVAAAAPKGAPDEEQLLRLLGVTELPKTMELLTVPTGHIAVSCEPNENTGCPGGASYDSAKGSKQAVSWYLWDLPAADKLLTGKDLDRARQDIDPTGGNPIVSMDFDGRGAKLFEQQTAELAAEGRAEWEKAGRPAGQEEAYAAAYGQFSIILDGELKSSPFIDFKKNPKGIGGGSAKIDLTSTQEAKDIALVLQSGSLPVTFVPLSQNQVSATLGKESLRQGLIAGLGGLIVVMIYMLIFYRFLGLIADIALLIYAALFYALILAIPVTMTLPGIAGMILTIGVAADANVVVFERIKEEVRLGRSVRSAISGGYAKGFRTIIDANAVTLITAGVLFIASQASVRGFAFLLALGVIVSMFTAVAATRALLGVLGGFRWFNNAAFMGANAKPIRWRMDFIRRRNLWFAISGVILLVGLGSLATRGLNQGIDFTGGTRVTVGLEGKAATPAQIKTAISGIDAKLAQAVVRGTGSSAGAATFSEFQIDAKELPNETIQLIRPALQKTFGDASVPQERFSNTSVSASFGAEILRGAIAAFLVSILLIVIYMAFRFDWKYAVPMIAALVHDLIITVGVYSLTGRQVTSATVAAVLTILGYSLYDTIIVFDRVRENEVHLRKHTYRQIVNISLWETLTRSLNTSFITLLPILSLFLFGGETLRDFAFALVIGIASGAYSSFFIACPLLAMIKERDPEFAKRRGTDELPHFLRREAVPAAPAVAVETPVPAAVGAVTASDAPAEPDGVAPEPQSGPRADVAEDEQAARDAARQRRLDRRQRRRR